jgi:thiamine biosynthesis lipoprotein
MKRLLPLLLTLTLLLGCTQTPQQTQKQYTATFLELFDTVTTVIGRADTEEAFQVQANAIRDALARYHRLFDIYNDYEGIVNIKTVNDQAGKSPVTVDPAIIALLQDCKTYYALTGGRVNVAMGSVLQLWHEARSDSLRDPQNAWLPDAAALRAAAAHTDLDSLVIDEANSTVFLTDPEVRLDVGAIAKGWATQQVAAAAPSGMLISVGGNVCATGPKTADGSPWVIGIQDPDNPDKNLHSLYVTGGSLVTSGDYQRYFQVNGQTYHHIIDPATQMPAAYWRTVSVLCSDSGLADALSTGLFLMDLEQGKALAAQCNAEVLWVDLNGNESMTAGFESRLRN